MWVPEISNPQEVHITPSMNIRRERVLSQPGEVLVDIGAIVEPETVVARSRTPGALRVLNLAYALDVAPEQVKSMLDKPVGESFEAGQPVASQRKMLGLTRRHVVSPIAGVLVEVDKNGYALLRGHPEPLELRASLRGHIANVMPRFGVVIELTGALIQGVWGTDGEASGVLKLLADDPAYTIEAESLDVSCRGTILVAGSATEPAFHAAVEHKARGMILGSLDVALRDTAQTLPFPIILLEGFGNIPICAPAFDLLGEMNGYDTFMSGQTGQYGSPTRPEIIISGHKNDNFREFPVGPWQPGDRVHLIAPPYTGQTGTVESLIPLGRIIPTGERIPGLQVQLDAGESVFIPWTNLERIR
ncbi:MAG: hypothetical protein GXP41_02780 [Chloroflexi bacterium]|nr:hypothetical protein [Chloroflexota bacterium]